MLVTAFIEVIHKCSPVIGHPVRYGLRPAPGSHTRLAPGMAVGVLIRASSFWPLGFVQCTIAIPRTFPPVAEYSHQDEAPGLFSRPIHPVSLDSDLNPAPALTQSLVVAPRSQGCVSLFCSKTPSTRIQRSPAPAEEQQTPHCQHQ